MIHGFKGPYTFSKKVLTDWNSDAVGVYYCGSVTPEGRLTVLYVGRAISDGGIRARLLEHLNEDKWPDVTHFGYEQCDYTTEAIGHETREIEKYKPKYNRRLA